MKKYRIKVTYEYDLFDSEVEALKELLGVHTSEEVMAAMKGSIMTEASHHIEEDCAGRNATCLVDIKEMEVESETYS